MNGQSKKFISPGSWFSLHYPSDWNEFEDMEGSFLFYNPGKWNGNFRISAFRAEKGTPGYLKYAEESIEEELKLNPTSVKVDLSEWSCAYSKETFLEEGEYYTTHLWITGRGNVIFECSFTVAKGGDKQPAEEIIATLEIRDEGKHRSAEIIPVRVLEVGVINEGFEWASATIKKMLKKDFTAVANDIPKIQQVIDSGRFDAGQKEVWQSLGIAFGAILVNEVDGMEWVSVVDGSSEYPALCYEESKLIVYPLQLIWDKLKVDQSCILSDEFEHIKKSVEALYK